MNELLNVLYNKLLKSCIMHKLVVTKKNCQGDINVVILDIKRNTLKRKLSEALYISRSKPSLNDKSELESIVKYL